MRKMHPAVTAGLSAAFVIMAGTGAIVGVDTLLHGSVPTASADSESAGFKTTTTITSNPAWKSAADTGSAWGQFEVEGTFKVERTNQTIWGTGPFTVTCNVPTVWQTYAPTEGESIQLDGKFVDWSVVGTKPSNVSVSIPSESGDSHITIEGTGNGLDANESVTITFKLRTTRNWGDTQPEESTINAILSTLGSSDLKIPDNISGNTGWTDYRHPGIANEQFTLARTGVSGDTSLVPGQSATGSFSATVTGNIYHAVVHTPTLSKPESGTGLDGINWAATPTKYVVYRLGQRTEHSFGDSVDLHLGDQITFNCEIATQGNMKIVADPVKVDVTITNTALDGQNGSKMDDWHKSSNNLSVNLASLRTGVTLDRSRVSVGDAPLAATLTLTPSDSVPSATVLLRLTNVNSSVAPNSVGVAFATASGVTLSENNTVAKVNVTNLNAEQSVALQIPVSALSATTLSQLYANPNFKLTATLDESANSICTHDSTGNTASFAVNEPKMKGATTASDPALPAISEAHPDVTVNLGDAAQFETVYEPKEQGSLAVLRGYQIKVNLASKDASGNALTAAEAKTFLKEAPVITVGSGDSWTPKAWTIKYYASKGGATVDAPTKASYFTVEPSEELAPGQKIKVTYKATISSASVRNMRGGSVTAEPEFVPSGNTNYVGTGDTFTGATVNVATVQVSPHLYVTEDEIAVGDKTTYMLTVQAARLSGASDNAAYALGLHATLALDDYSFGFGYAHNRDSIKVYRVDNGTTAEIQKGGIDGYTLDVDEENKTQCTISLPETSKIPVLSNLKDVNESKETGTAGGIVSGDDTGTTPSSNPTTENATIEETSNSSNDTGSTSANESDSATKTKLDVKGLATEIKSGYIITFDGTTDGIKSLTGVLGTNTDAAVRADNASFAVSSKNVNVKGGKPEEFVLKPYAEPTQGGANGSGGTNSKTGTNKSDIPQLDASVPQVIAMMLGSAAAWWGARKWRNSKR